MTGDARAAARDAGFAELPKDGATDGEGGSANQRSDALAANNAITSGVEGVGLLQQFVCHVLVCNWKKMKKSEVMLFTTTVATAATTRRRNSVH
jgi:hypothetical protein